MHRRPVFVTLLSVLVLTLTVWNGVRCYSALTSWSLLQELEAHPGPLYIALTGLIWAASGLALFRGLWLGRSWARPAAWFYIGLYLAYFWLDRFFFRPDERTQNYVLLLVLQLAVVGVTGIALSTSSGKTFFR
jgi:hypothetical protein